MTLIQKEDGSIHACELPEEPSYGDCHMYAAIEGSNPNVMYSDAMKAHAKAYEEALSKSLPVSDQELATRLIMGNVKVYKVQEMDSEGNIIPSQNEHIVMPEKNKPYKIEGWTVEEKEQVRNVFTPPDVFEWLDINPDYPIEEPYRTIELTSKGKIRKVYTLKRIHA